MCQPPPKNFTHQVIYLSQGNLNPGFFGGAFVGSFFTGPFGFSDGVLPPAPSSNHMAASSSSRMVIFFPFPSRNPPMLSVDEVLWETGVAWKAAAPPMAVRVITAESFMVYTGSCRSKRFVSTLLTRM